MWPLFPGPADPGSGVMCSLLWGWGSHLGVPARPASPANTWLALLGLHLSLAVSRQDLGDPRCPWLGPLLWVTQRGPGFLPSPPPGLEQSRNCTSSSQVLPGSPGSVAWGPVWLSLLSEAGLCWCHRTLDGPRWMGVTIGFLPRFLEGGLAEAWASVPKGPALLGWVPEASGVICGCSAWPGVLWSSWAVSVLASRLGLQPSHVPVPGHRAVGWTGGWLPQEAPAPGPKGGGYRALVASSCCVSPEAGELGAPGDRCRKPRELCACLRVSCTLPMPRSQAVLP